MENQILGPEVPQTISSSQSGAKIKVTQTVYNGIKQPKLGDIVILHLADGDTIQNNNAKELPAIVSRVFFEGPPFTINLKGLPDGTGTIWRTSVLHQEGVNGAVIAQGPSWRWPDEKLKRGEAPMQASE